jgi:predicted GIY-YIG superfamily endonuclease
MLRDKLLARLAEMGPAPDLQLVAAEVLGIRNASPELARRLVSQALVVEDRREVWRRAGERICAGAPATPGVYVLRDDRNRALYVGKAVNLRRRLRAHFAERRWRAIGRELGAACDAEWIEVGSELEALVREQALIRELQPIANIQVGAPELDTRSLPPALVRDVVVVVRSVEIDSAELVCVRPDGGWFIQRTRRSGADLAVHTRRVKRFFVSALRRGFDGAPIAPVVYSWLAGRGAEATRLDPHDHFRERLAAVLRDDQLFIERLDQRTARGVRL